jgi:hypothetical protein
LAGCTGAGPEGLGSTFSFGSPGTSLAPTFRVASPVVVCSACSVGLTSGWFHRSRTRNTIAITHTTQRMNEIVAGTTLLALGS